MVCSSVIRPWANADLLSLFLKGKRCSSYLVFNNFQFVPLTFLIYILIVTFCRFELIFKMQHTIGNYIKKKGGMNFSLDGKYHVFINCQCIIFYDIKQIPWYIKNCSHNCAMCFNSIRFLSTLKTSKRILLLWR